MSHRIRYFCFVSVISGQLWVSGCTDSAGNGGGSPDAGGKPTTDAAIDSTSGHDSMVDAIVQGDCGVIGDESCGSRSDCSDDCSGHGRCISGMCMCDRGYAGTTCAGCADGFEPDPSDGATCVTSICVNVSCGPSEVCDDTGACCEDACDEGTSVCMAGTLRFCERDPGGCTSWTVSVACTDALCECPVDGSALVVTQWGNGGGDEMFDLAPRPGGGAYVVGVVSGFPGQPFDGDDIFLGEVRSPADGHDPVLLTFGTSAGDRGSAVAVAPDGTIVVGAEVGAAFDGEMHIGQRDVLVVAVSPQGEIQWATQIGTRHQDEVWGVAVSPTGDIFIAGNTVGSFDNPTGPRLSDREAFVTRLSVNGDPIWVEQWGVVDADARALDVDVDASDHIYVAGTAGGPSCRKLDGDGHMVWDVDLGGGPGTRSVSAANDSGCLAGGLVDGGRGFVARISSGGDITWNETLPDVGFVTVTSLALGPTGRLFVAGNVEGELMAGGVIGGRDGFIAEVSMADGSLLGTRQYGTTESDSVHTLTVASDGTIVLAGSTRGDFPGFVSSGGSDAFVLTDDAP